MSTTDWHAHAERISPLSVTSKHPRDVVADHDTEPAQTRAGHGFAAANTDVTLDLAALTRVLLGVADVVDRVERPVSIAPEPATPPPLPERTFAAPVEVPPLFEVAEQDGSDEPEEPAFEPTAGPPRVAPSLLVSDLGFLDG